MSQLARTALLAGILMCAVESRSVAQTVIFSDDFESGSTQWTLEADWHLTGVEFGCFVAPGGPPSGTQVARFGQPGICNFGAAKGRMTTASPIPIPSDVQGARLRFMSYEFTECGFGNCGWDERRIFVSRNQGLTWLNVWEGGKEGVWLQKSIDLSVFAGGSILIAFEFDPVDNWVNDFAGWLVDDVRLEVDLPGDPTIYCSAKVNSLSCKPEMHYSGSTSMSGPDDLQLTCTNLRNNVFGGFIWSLSSANTTFQGGILCVALPAKRTLFVSTGGSSFPTLDCSGGYAWPFTHAYLSGYGLGAGSTFYVQYTGRDAGLYVVTLSDAVKVTLLP